MKSNDDPLIKLLLLQTETFLSKEISATLSLIGADDIETLESKGIKDRIFSIRQMLLKTEGDLFSTQGLKDLHELLSDVIGCYLRKLAIHTNTTELCLEVNGLEKHELIRTEESLKHSVQYWAVDCWSEKHLVREEFRQLRGI